ncbi:MAG: PTS galactosamine transporter subunit IIB [Erysipelotrichaceae bacterium]|nr:PTS galactosamine transporter subunit IIB [Erysipelotrichaceae bacterium]
MKKANIVYTRVDNRLIHGQVANVWLSAINTNLIVVVDDEVSTNDMLQNIMKLTADAKGIGVRFFSVEKTIKVINNASEKQKIFLVAKTPNVIRRLVDNGVPIDKCNIGNMHFSEGKNIYKDPHVYVDKQDLDDIDYLKNKGLSVFIQITPTSPRYNL